MSTIQVKKRMLAALERIGKCHQEKRMEGAPQNYKILPPMLATAAVYNDRLRMAKVFCVGTVLVCGSIVAIQEYRFRGALEHSLNKEFLIIPGVVDFMKVRPGTIPDNVVFYFAEYMAEQIGTFSHSTIEEKYTRVSQFMSPPVREAFLLAMRKNLATYRDLAVTEIFSPKPAGKFDVSKDEAGNPVYVVHVEGNVDQYTNDQKLKSTAEVITLQFRTTRITSDKPWFFEVTSLIRQSREEFVNQENARVRLSQKTGASAP